MMRAAVLYGPRDLRVEDVPSARPPGEGELRLSVIAVGLCGTDVHEYLNAPVLTPLSVRNTRSGHVGPIIIGHEVLGRVETVGPGPSEFRVGDRVVAGAGVSCGTCEPCKQGRTNLCVSYYTFGLQADGGLAEAITVPAQMCVAVPDQCTDDDAVLAQPVAIAMHAVERSRVTAGECVAVIGSGAIGSLLIVGLVSAGANVTVLDVDASRLGMARELGATRQLHAPPTAEEVATLRASFDAVFDTSGSGTGVANALRLAKPGGRIIAVGMPSNNVQFDSRSAVINEIDVITSSAHVCSVNLPAAVALLAAHSIHRLIVDRTVSLDNIVLLGLDPLANRELAGKVIVRIATPKDERQAS
jgi:(R,R)-butanediol dehydrogenase/meso-butanediol dehydrogenase/diacetyl reductase